MHISRLQAFFSHLGLSLLILAFFAYLIVHEWYPQPFFEVDGGWHGLRILFFVDIVLGPGLTLLLFKPGKPGLKFDMTMVIVFQIIALSYGMWHVYSSRPSVVVFFDGKYNCLDHRATAGADLDFLRTEKTRGPAYAFLSAPGNLAEYSDFLLKGIHGGKSSIYTYMDKYENLTEENVNKMLDFNLDLQALSEKEPQWKKTWEESKAIYENGNNSYAYFPMVCRFKRVTSIVDKSSGKIVDIINMYIPPVELKRPYILEKD